MPRGRGIVPLWRQIRELSDDALTEERVRELIEQALDERFGKKPKPDKT